MAEVTASMVKELRELTGLGMMECKKALSEADGDLKKAEELLRIKSGAKASKAAGRVAAEGVIGIFVAADGKTAAMVELNCETDFVARNEDFQTLAKQLVMHAQTRSPVRVTHDAFLAETLDGKSIDEVVKLASGKTGEAMTVKQVAKFGGAGGVVGEYRHHNSQVGVLVELGGASGASAIALARDIALHVASADPIAVAASDIPPELLDRERRIAEEMVAAEGKPEAIRAKIVEGKVKKFAQERALLEQPFVKDESVTIGALVARLPGANVVRFARFKVGEA